MSEAYFWSATSGLRRRYNRLWIADHLARTVTRRETVWTRRRLAAYETLRATALGLGARRTTVDRVEDLSPRDFKRRYLDTDTPVVLAGAGSRWPAARWTHRMIAERYGGTKVRLLRAAPNEPKGRPGEGRDASYAEIAESMEGGGDLYARFSGIMHQHPELVADLDLDWFRDMRHDRKRFENWGFFMGGAGTATGLHSSIAPNLFFQITGRKRWYIYPAKAAPFFNPAVKCSPYFYSEVDIDDPERWPIAAATPGWIADLEPGDVLYVPSFAWHQVHNATATMAVGYRWVDPKLGWRASPVQTLLVATCSNPPLWKAKGHKDLPTLLDAIDY
jgi:[protein]-arginine 3-hydroxylase / protease